MIPEKIVATARLYQTLLEAEQISPKRISLDIPLGQTDRAELLSHALYLAIHVPEHIAENNIGKANRHLGAMQMILSFTGHFTIRELMSHNQP